MRRFYLNELQCKGLVLEVMTASRLGPNNHRRGPASKNGFFAILMAEKASQELK